MKKLTINYYVFVLMNFIIVCLLLACDTQHKQPQQQDDNIKTVTAEAKKEPSKWDVALPIVVNSAMDSLILNQYKNGKKEGVWREFYEKGRLRSEGVYKDGKKEGLHREWWKNGELSLEGTYENGTANGLMKWYNEKGRLVAVGKMIEDKRSGPWKICDVHDASLCIDANFKADKREGRWKIYEGNNEVWKEQLWKNDRLVSEKCKDKKGKAVICN
ncbi:toxin-antitoxin system YwqK family antitoxin [Aureispira anguillae]|uniref:Toxin-antitoxin system YwqK family antitoxin n=1 Tax=Aureispira anguillae TaxID=2864201 RepID=A0A915YCB1_9BACT|nr:hypothetical protein [Aureispira anguillae]BDS10429.1 hypothetical protein AsAng_0011370 [Aureispira anguillae]